MVAYFPRSEHWVAPTLVDAMTRKRYPQLFFLWQLPPPPASGWELVECGEQRDELCPCCTWHSGLFVSQLINLGCVMSLPVFSSVKWVADTEVLRAVRRVEWDNV